VVTTRAKALGKALLSRLVADYRINWIHAVDKASPDADGEEGLSAIPARPSITHRYARQPELRTGRAGYWSSRADRFWSAHFAKRGQYDCDGICPLDSDEVALVEKPTKCACG
jgi:hypothetical protein